VTVGFSREGSLGTMGLFIEISIVSFSLSVVGMFSVSILDPPSITDLEAKWKGPFLRRSEFAITAVDAAFS
jgi:hypothetical protein